MTALRFSTLVMVSGLCLACSDGSGPSQTLLQLRAAVDNVPWAVDTAGAFAFGAPTDTTLAITAVRTVSAAEEQQISFSVHGFTGQGQFTLADPGSEGVGAFSVSRIAGGVVQSTTVYLTHASPAGTVTITHLDRTDSTVAGTFAFEAALTPDTAPHRHVTGSFRLRLAFVPVFVPQRR